MTILKPAGNYKSGVFAQSAEAQSAEAQSEEGNKRATTCKYDQIIRAGE